MNEVLNVVNGCVLFPHAADWRMPPAPRRTWETEIAETIKGAEARASMRAVPRREVTFLVTADLEERVRLEARMDAAAESGYGAAPLHGRGSTLLDATPAGSQANILLNTAGWFWKAGDYAILIRDDLNYDLAAVINVGLTADGIWTADSSEPVNAPALSLAAPLGYSWPANTLVWPVIFGRFTAKKEQALTGWHGAAQITVTELTSARSVQIGAQPAQAPGVGQQVIGKTNVVA